LSAAAVVDRVRWQVDAWTRRPGAITSGVVLVRLAAEQVRPDEGSQEGLWGGRSERDEAALRAVARLTSLAEGGAVEVPVWSGGRSPVDRHRWVPADTVDLLDAARVSRDAAPWPGALPAPAPTVVHRDPPEVHLLDISGEPVLVTGRGEMSSAPHELVDRTGSRRIVAWAGPWPLHERWWSPTVRRSARLQVVLDDDSAHLVAVQRRQWSIEATYE
jgi:protein ImuB